MTKGFLFLLLIPISSIAATDVGLRRRAEIRNAVCANVLSQETDDEILNDFDRMYANLPSQLKDISYDIATSYGGMWGTPIRILVISSPLDSSSLSPLVVINKEVPDPTLSGSFLHIPSKFHGLSVVVRGFEARE